MAHDIPGARTVPPETIQPLSREVRVRNLGREIDAIEGPVLIVAHSAGVLITAHWVQTDLVRAARRIAGAVLVTPPDLERPLPEGYPTMGELSANGWMPVPRTVLPFPAILGASTNDPLASLEHAQQLASHWRCQLEILGAVGHLNPASGFGPWPDAHRLIDQVRNMRNQR